MPVSSVSLHEGGSRVSRLAFGAWRLHRWEMTAARLRELIETAVELGITTVDLADIYGDYLNEELFGEALAGDVSLRDQMQLVSKCGIKLVSPRRPAHRSKVYDTSRAHIIASVENSLRQLRTDRLDLLLIHRPDPLMDADETAGALSELVRAGKVLHVGVSNFTPSQFELLASRLDVPLVTNQIAVSVLRLDAFFDGTLDQCQRLRVAPMAWSPLGGGQLFHGEDAQLIRLRGTLAEVGEQMGGASLDQVALAWLLTHPAKIVPVLGSGRIERLRSAAAADSLRLTRDQWFAVWTASGADIP